MRSKSKEGPPPGVQELAPWHSTAQLVIRNATTKTPEFYFGVLLWLKQIEGRSSARSAGACYGGSTVKKPIKSRNLYTCSSLWVFICLQIFYKSSTNQNTPKSTHIIRNKYHQKNTYLPITIDLLKKNSL